MPEKSTIGTNKEKHEEEVLNCSIRLSKNKKKITRNILTLMNGETVDRMQNDKPDIIRVFCTEQGTNVYNGLIGIEHFLVEQVSVYKKGKRVSYINENKNPLKRMIEKKEEILSDPIQLQQAKEKIANAIFDIGVQANKSGIQELKDSFCDAFDRHLSRAEEYRKNIWTIANGRHIRLAFLIEIHCFADDVFLNNGRTVIRRHNDIYPLFNWMIDKLEEADSAIIDYFVIYIRNSVNEKSEDVIAVDTKNIRQSLRKQQILIYEYCDDPSSIDYLKSNIPGEGLSWKTTVINQDSFMKKALPSLRQAYEYKKRSIPFVASRIVQGMIYAFGKYTFKDDEFGTKIVSEYSQEEAYKRFVAFCNKYSVTDE